MAILLRFSRFALLGKVGIISFGLGLGSSVKYLCSRMSSALGREDGFIESKDEISRRPAVDKYGNLEALSCDAVNLAFDNTG